MSATPAEAQLNSLTLEGDFTAEETVDHLRGRVWERGRSPEIMATVEPLIPLNVRLIVEAGRDDAASSDRIEADRELTLNIAPGHGIVVAEQLLELEDERGTSDEGPSISVRGNWAHWIELCAGRRSWVHAVNAELGTLAVAGDPVAAAWLTPVLSQLFTFEPPNDSDRGGNPTGATLPEATVQMEREARAAASLQVRGAYVLVRGAYAHYETIDAMAETAITGVAENEPGALHDSRIPLLLLHTAGRDSRQWHPAMAELSTRFRCIAPDLPGHGKSFPLGPEGCLDEIGELANWLLELMGALGASEFMVAGTSVGGNLSLLLAARSQHVRGVVALQGADFTPTISETSLSMMRHPRVSLPHSSVDLALSLVGDKAVPEARDIIAWSIRELSPPAQHGDLSAYSRTDIRSEMPAIRCPVLLVHGDQDWLANRKHIDQTSSRITGAAALEVRSLPGIGHYPHIEAPSLVADMIHEWADRTVNSAGN